MKQPVVVMSMNPAFVTYESGYSPLQRTAALGYLGAMNGRPWDLAVPSRLSDGWMLVHHCRNWWRMCAVSDCLECWCTSQAISCGRTYHVDPLFLVLRRKSAPWLALRNVLWSRRTDVIILSHVFVISLIPFPTNGRMTYQSRAGQIQRKGRPHNSLRTRLRAALVYTYIGKWKVNQLKRRYLSTISYAKSTVEWTG